MDYTSLTLPQLIAAAETSSAEVRRLEATLRAAQHSITDLENHYKDACTQIEYLQSSNAAYIESNRECELLNRAAFAKKEELKGKLKCARAAEHKAIAALEAMKNYNSELKAKLGAAEQKIASLEAQNSQMAAEVIAATNKYEQLERDHKSYRFEREVQLNESTKKHGAALCRIMRLEGQLDALETAKGDTANEHLVAVNIELREKLHKAQTAADIEPITPVFNAGAACAENFAHHEAAIVKMREQIRILQQAVFPANRTSQ